MFSHYFDYIKTVNSDLKRRGIYLFDVQEDNLPSQVAIMEELFYLNEKFKQSGGNCFIPSQYTETPMSYLRANIYREYLDDWYAELEALTRQPDDAGELDLSSASIESFMEKLGLDFGDSSQEDKGENSVISGENTMLGEAEEDSYYGNSFPDFMSFSEDGESSPGYEFDTPDDDEEDEEYDDSDDLVETEDEEPDEPDEDEEYDDSLEEVSEEPMLVGEDEFDRDFGIVDFSGDVSAVYECYAMGVDDSSSEEVDSDEGFDEDVEEFEEEDDIYDDSLEDGEYLDSEEDEVLDEDLDDSAEDELVDDEEYDDSFEEEEEEYDDSFDEDEEYDYSLEDDEEYDESLDEEGEDYDDSFEDDEEDFDDSFEDDEEDFDDSFDTEEDEDFDDSFVDEDEDFDDSLEDDEEEYDDSLEDDEEYDDSLEDDEEYDDSLEDDEEYDDSLEDEDEDFDDELGGMDDSFEDDDDSPSIEDYMYEDAKPQPKKVSTPKNTTKTAYVQRKHEKNADTFVSLVNKGISFGGTKLKNKLYGGNKNEN